MEWYWIALIAYLVIINIIAIAMYAADKKKAVKKEWRTKEATLIGVAVLGGSVGALYGIFGLRHKSKHPKFYIGVPVIFAVQIAIAVAVFLIVK